jgi:hypothetical protein
LQDFADKDMLQNIKLARFLFGEVESLRREARCVTLLDKDISIATLTF